MSSSKFIYKQLYNIHPFYDLEVFNDIKLYYSFRHDWNEKNGYCTFSNTVYVNNCECDITVVFKIDVIGKDDLYNENMAGRHLWTFDRDERGNKFTKYSYLFE